MKTKFNLLAVATLALLSTINHQLSTACAQGTAFTYQGQLQNNGALAGGAYNLTFTLYTNSTGGTAVAGPLTNNSVAISNGLFTVTLDFGAIVWNGTVNWLEIAVETNGAGSFTTLAPRQQVTPTPYAIFATGTSNLVGVVPSGSLSGSYSGAVSLTNAGNSFTGNGSGLTGVNAGTLGGLAASNFWQTAGNSGTSAGPNFLGTVDNQPLELHVNGQRGLRLEPTVDAPNVIVGGSLNTIQPGSSDCTISGGQNSLIQSNTLKATISGGYGHTIKVGAYESTIGGGFGDAIGTNSPDATIAGGFEHIIGNNAANAVIGGGYQNSIAGYVPSQGLVTYSATIAGGKNNVINSNSATSSIGGGAFNSIQSNATYATVSGGLSNVAAQVGVTIGGGGYDGVNNVFGNVVSANGATVAGGVGNNIQPSAGDSTIGGGFANTIQSSAPYSTIAGGRQNQIAAGAWYTFIGGGLTNSIGGNAFYSVIAGGDSNVIQNFATNSTIGGGSENTVTASYSTIAGGDLNAATAAFASVGGGYNNGVHALYAAILGGFANNILPGGASSLIAGGNLNTINAPDSAIVAGSENTLDGNGASTIAGGIGNDILSTAEYAFIAGGVDNTNAGYGSFAAGVQASVGHDNTFVWSDGSATTQSSLNHEFLARASEGVLFLTSTDYTTGVFLPGGSGTWSNLSDRNSKNNFAPINPQMVLAQVASLPLTTWSYKTQTGVRHVGPMAQDFYAAFQVGEDDRHISELDESGVALAAIQALNQKLDDKSSEIQQLKQQNEMLQKRLDNLEQTLKSITKDQMR